jgi:indolepyruvate ferredoxin oxidoreductase
MGANEQFLTASPAAPERERLYLSGMQALVQLPMLQRRLDREGGLKTAGLVSGYRGSPLGAYDQQLWKAKAELEAHDIRFQPGLNEDLAATALWGAQIHRAFGDTQVDGVFGIWYGKGPGVDRTGDVFRSANVIGTSRYGGVLAVSGDDHAAQSSMYPHQTDGIFQAASIPVLQPATVEEVIRFGLAGIAMSRYCGVWVGLKTIAEVIEATGSVDVVTRPQFLEPQGWDRALLNWDPAIAWPAQRAELERRLIDVRLPAVRAWAHTNGIDREVISARERRIGVITVGKAHQDFLQAMDNLQLPLRELQAHGVSVYKVGMSWPLDTAGAVEFAAGHEQVLVLEEKRGYVEAQLKDALYHLPAARRPLVVGKLDERGDQLLPETSEFDPLLVARVFTRRAAALLPALGERLARLEAAGAGHSAASSSARRPYFCSGCPHNTSTKVPDGSRAGGGIGCHVMALSQPELRTSTFCQMGGEGAQWIGAAPFSKTPHLFQNLGDGTYQHSGLLAIRAAVAAGTNITYKILYNDAVAMTGGQAAEGLIEPARITRQLAAEGVDRIALVSDAPSKWKRNPELAPGVTVHHRDDLEAVQKEFRGISGVTAIVYEQTCAAEKRRRRKRGQLPDPDRRLFINAKVCEGCGDCSIQSNCISIEPKETPLGRKRTINQSACNKDFSCVKGFCPSFVELEGAQLRKPDRSALEGLLAELGHGLAMPTLVTPSGVFNIYVAGIGGSGVLTSGALLGSAAHFDGRRATVLDFTGLAQKNGAVISQVRIAVADGAIHASRIDPASVDLLLGADTVVSAAADALLRFSPQRTASVLNTEESPTADFVTNRDAAVPSAALMQRVRERSRTEGFHALEFGRLCRAIFGDTVAVHTLMLGYAWQKGLVPLSEAALMQAVERNGAAVAMNRSAFQWGRVAAEKLERLESALGLCATPAAPMEPQAVLLGRLSGELAAYQDGRYAARFTALMEQVQRAAASVPERAEQLADIVGQAAFRVMAYKDEYEVARLYASPEFRASLAVEFDRTRKVSVWLAPPLLARKDPATGRPRKMKFGPWVFPFMKGLAALRVLRGTPLDVFGYTAERRAERDLARSFEADLLQLLQSPTQRSLELVEALARSAQEVRGFGLVKEAALQRYAIARARILAGDVAAIERRAAPVFFMKSV